MENIICKKLNFSYPNSESSVLNDVSFSVDEGELCLVIGKSGAGKSTLLKLMKKERKMVLMRDILKAKMKMIFKI